ncbi:MAG: type II secretion system minor pseudopilin GspH [Legionellaceae bacterium]|nr:type II secretion system minor pseudopilin GspH [Legionellaceae bacterium]
MPANSRIYTRGNLYKSSGFTLIEILVVVLIIGIIISFAMLSFGDFGERRKIINSAQHFVNYVGMVKKEAILESNTLAIRINKNRYDVLRFESSSKWRPIAQRIFTNQQFPKESTIFFTANNKKVNKNMIVINPSGEITPFTLNFAKNKDIIVATVIAKSNGSVIVNTP